MSTKILWQEYSVSLSGFIRSRVKEEAITKDILQETFIRAHLHQNKIKEPKAVKSWLFRVANNLISDYFRGEVKKSEVQELPAAEKEVEEHTPADCLLPLIEQLPETYKRAMILSEIEGKKQKEVAQILEISVSGAKSRIQRGRKLLQQGFMNCCNYSLNDSGYLVGENRSAEECRVCR